MPLLCNFEDKIEKRVATSKRNLWLKSKSLIRGIPKLCLSVRQAQPLKYNIVAISKHLGIPSC